MKKLKFKESMKKVCLKNDTLNKLQLQKFIVILYTPRDSKIDSDKGFVNNDNGSMGETHWTCFCSKS